MPPKRSTRSLRRKAAARTILGALDENETAAATGSALSASTKTTDSSAGNGETARNPSDDAAIQLPSDFDGSDPSTIRLLLEDISREVKKRQDSIDLLADQAKFEQQEAAFVHKLKIQKSVRTMTVRDFNSKFGGDALAEVRKAMAGGLLPPLVAGGAAGKKRDRPEGTKVGAPKGRPGGAMALETPAPKGGGVEGHAPGTAMRTVKRGEAMFSVNGSPVDKAEEGDLVATVCKKRKGNAGGAGGSANNGAAVFDINVGDGRYVNLSDPGTVQHLDQDMKNTAMSQLKVLQNQMASLMTQLGN